MGRLSVLEKDRYEEVETNQQTPERYCEKSIPFDGLGKPEPLKHKYAGFRSRRIDREHRLIYKYEEDAIYIAKCRFHYD